VHGVREKTTNTGRRLKGRGEEQSGLAGISYGTTALEHDGWPEQTVVAAKEARTSTAR
jgi:hypothetical protein